MGTRFRLPVPSLSRHSNQQPPPLPCHLHPSPPLSSARAPSAILCIRDALFARGEATRGWERCHAHHGHLFSTPGSCRELPQFCGIYGSPSPHPRQASRRAAPGRGSGGFKKCRGAGIRLLATPGRQEWCPCPPHFHGIPRRPSSYPWGVHRRTVPSPAPGRGSGGFEKCRGAG